MVKASILAARGGDRGGGVFGIVFVLPIGGADMPVVISLLNAFTGLAAAATGFVLHNERADRRAGCSSAPPERC